MSRKRSLIAEPSRRAQIWRRAQISRRAQTPRPGGGLLLIAMLALAGCGEAQVRQSQPPNPEKEKQPIFTHRVNDDTPYYSSGPQQGRPPDGTIAAGTLVQVIEANGSHWQIRSADELKAFVASDSLVQVAQGGAAAAEDYAAVVSGNNQFALDLYAQLADENPGNLFFSPLSVSAALAMTLAGAKGQTEQQMAEVLHLSLPPGRLHPAFDAFTSEIFGANTADYQLRMANRLWGQENEKFLPGYLQLTDQFYDAPLAQVDFVGQSDAARKQINSWVEEQTEQKIKNLLPDGAVDRNTRLVLTNAIYFKGQWTHPFQQQKTRQAPFHLTAADEAEVPMMQQKERFSYLQADGLQVLQLPYGKGGDLAMIVLLPAEVDGLPALEDALTLQKLRQWTAQLRSQEVDVSLPRFRMTSQFQLHSTLRAMGMTAAFDPQQADLSGISKEQELFLSAAIHKAFVEVNEEGTEAAAATGAVVGITAIAETPNFRADRPFLFLIQHQATGSLLFIGRVVDPRAGNPPG